jgi:hypothetical protein
MPAKVGNRGMSTLRIQNKIATGRITAMTKPADERTAKAREQEESEIRERAKNFRDSAEYDHICDTTYSVEEEELQTLTTFALSERSSAIKEVREECARAVCGFCAGDELHGLPTEAATWTTGITGQNGRWIHKTSRDDLRAECKAAAIRALGER